jgi:hypothetical protein
MKTVKPSAAHAAFRAAMLATMRQHAADMPAEEILALTAHMVGQILAMQDQRKMTPAMGMKLIADNIEQGNREVIDGLSKSEGTT